MRERDIENYVCKYASSKEMLVMKFTSPGTTAVCDRIFIDSGNVFFIEFKAPGKKPTVAQNNHHKKLASKNVAVYVIDDKSTGKEVIDYEYENKGAKHHWRAIRVTDCS